MQFQLNICQDCLDLKGEMCDTPECIFCRRTMSEVSEYLDVLLIRPIIDGVQVGVIKTSSAYNSNKALVDACENYVEARTVFDALDPNNPDCGPEVMRYAMAKNTLETALALAKKKG